MASAARQGPLSWPGGHASPPARSRGVEAGHNTGRRRGVLKIFTPREYERSTTIARVESESRGFMKLASDGYGGPSRERRRARKTVLLILPVLGILGAAALVWVLPGHVRQGASSRAVRTAGPCPGARSCPYGAAAIVGQPDRGLLRVPEALAVGPGGHVYVGDQFSYAVRRFSPRGRLEAEWGSYGAGPGQFGAIAGLAVGPGGDVFVVDSGHDRVERFAPGGRLLGSWGGQGARIGQLHLGSGPTPDHPPGGAIAVSGRYVYVADTSNNRIERFDLNGSHPLVLIPEDGSPAGSTSPAAWPSSTGNSMSPTTATAASKFST